MQQFAPRSLLEGLYSLARCCRPEIRTSSRFRGYMAQQLPACVHPNSNVVPVKLKEYEERRWSTDWVCFLSWPRCWR